MRTIFFVIGFLLLVFHTSVAQPKNSQVRKYIQDRAAPLVKEYAEFLSIPNVAADSAGLQKTADRIAEMMRQRGIQEVQFLPAGTPGVPPAVYGEVMVPGAVKTLVFYAHYDGQPVNPDQWAEGLEPFKPLFYSGRIDKDGRPLPVPAGGAIDPEWRIYARSASDDKAGVFAILNGWAALRESRLKPACNLKFFFEGEEEAGSTHLPEILKKHQALLKSDLWIICDGPVHQSGKKQIVFGVRGDAHLDLTVYGPKRPLHSGHYGNWAPNPAMTLVKLLASMKDENGRVTIKDFYEDVTPLTVAEQKALSEVPSVDEQMKAELGLNAPEMKGLSLVEAINLPSLNINGIQSGNVGKMASNQIPTFATAVLDLRLVLGNDWQKQQQKVIKHMEAQGFHVTDREPTDEERARYPKLIRVIGKEDGYNAQRTTMDLPIIQNVIKAVRSTTSYPLVLQPTMGGSLPLYVFEQILAAKTVTVPIANADNNQHAENENIRLGNLFDGIETMAAIMLMEASK